MTFAFHPFATPVEDKTAQPETVIPTSGHTPTLIENQTVQPDPERATSKSAQETICFKVTTEEKEKMQAAATNAAMNLSEFIRSKLITPSTAPTIPSELEEAPLPAELPKYRNIPELYWAIRSSTDYIRRDLTDVLYHALRAENLVMALAYYDEDEDPETEMPEVFEHVSQAYEKASKMLRQSIHRIYPYANQEQVDNDAHDDMW